MRAMIVAAIAAVVLGAANYFALNARQVPTGVVDTFASARIDPYWAWRGVVTEAGAHATCEPRRPWQWIFVDFHDPAGESPLCSYSQ
jgi:hypothetical protein